MTIERLIELREVASQDLAKGEVQLQELRKRGVQLEGELIAIKSSINTLTILIQEEQDTQSPPGL